MEFSDAFATGSSIMPQKKNPDAAELIRGKTGRLVGALVAVLTMLKGLPLSYNSDMQEDKEPFFDAVDTIDAILDVFPPLVDSLTFRTDRMRRAAGEHFSTATDLADYLVRKGLPFRQAHEVVGDRSPRRGPWHRPGCALLDELRVLAAHRPRRPRGDHRRGLAPRAP